MPKQAGERRDRGPRVVLVGMMGSGKTTVGRLVAARLRTEFADTDEVIETASGVSVPEMFEQNGEKEFRRAESEALAKLLGPEGPHVVAVGGGAVLDDANRQVMQREATVVWLRARVGTLTARVGTGEGRPLLAGGSHDRLSQLSQERESLYEDLCDIVVDTDDISPEEVADLVVSAVSWS